MASVTAALKGMRSHTPVTTLTPLAVLWFGGMTASTSGLVFQTGWVGLAVGGPIVLLCCMGLVSAIDRLLRMRSGEARWWMFGSFVLFASLLGTMAVLNAVGDPTRDHPQEIGAALFVSFMLYLAAREFGWLRANKGTHGSNR